MAAAVLDDELTLLRQKSQLACGERRGRKLFLGHERREYCHAHMSDPLAQGRRGRGKSCVASVIGTWRGGNDLDDSVVYNAARERIAGQLVVHAERNQLIWCE